MSLLRKIPAKPVLALLMLSLPLSGMAQWKKKRNRNAPAPTASSKSGIDYKSIGAPLPPIRGVYPGKAVYTNKDVQNGANLFVMMFNPTCEHCEALTVNLEKNISLFKKSNLLLLAAPGMGDYLTYFNNNTRADQYETIKVALDSSDFIQNTFLYESLPQVNVYSPEGKLLKSFSGITTIDSLRQYIQ